MKSNQTKPIATSMFSIRCWMLNVAVLATAASALADVHYVDVNSTNATPPYLSWTTAARNIQDAVDAAVAGDEVVVTNGNYATGSRAVNGYPFGYNRVAVDKPLSIRSINGPQSTTIQAGNFSTDLRCVYLTNGASLSGFTLTRGCSRIGGGAYGGTLNNCTITRNTTYCGAESYDAYGGGAAHCTLNNCTLTGNSVVAYGRSFGGGAASCTLNNCTLTGNSAYNHSLSSSSEAYGGGASGCTLNNCTLSDNSFGFTGAQRFGGGAYQCALNNCIVYFNSGANYYSCALNYCCTTPPPTSGVGNITNAPLFVDGNLRSQSNSPCINAGNNYSVTSATDLDGNPRIVGGRVDMGAYEFQAVRYVDVNSTNATPPYSSWATAAASIQEAVDAAVAGDEIVVTNGIYTTGGRATVYSTISRVAVDKPLNIRSVNGAESTIIRGGCDVRCVYLTDAASLSGFTLSRGNLSYSSGGAAWGGTLNNCTLTRNAAFANGGGAIYSTLNNCVLTGNSSGDMHVRCGLAGFDNLAANGGGASYCTLNNCTLSGNWTRGGWLSGGGDGAYGGMLNNCIVLDGCLDSILNGCWRTDPLFVDEPAGNLRLQSNSPCINAGNPYVTGATDLDGNPRIVGGTMDIGAYEFQSPISIISYAWLQQFNLPINPSTDTADADGDTLNNWQEWRCWTDPTNALSALRLLTPVAAGGTVAVAWQSVPGVSYFLERGTNLAASPAFTPLAANLAGQAGTTTYTDTNAIGAGPFFYRVGVGD